MRSDLLQSDAGGIFQLLRDGVPRTRSELATLTGLSRPTVTLRLQQLTGTGLITPVTGAVSTGGRPSSQFAFNPSARVVVAADFGASHARIAVTDLGGTVLAEHSEPWQISSGPEASLDWLATVINRLLRAAQREPGELAGIGIGLPGPVEFSSGRPINPPIMPGWNKFDVRGTVQARFAVPVLVDNDVNIMALGERTAAWADVDNLMFVKVATGIGAGVISGGHLRRGSQGAAGDIGHVRVARAGDIPCSCGNRGCLEAIASGRAIVHDLTARSIAVSTPRDVVALANSGNVATVDAVRQAGRDIGEVLSVCVSVLNPSIIVIGGSMAGAGEHLLAGVREVVYARSIPLLTEHLRIVASLVGRDAAILGAAQLAIDAALSPERVAVEVG